MEQIKEYSLPPAPAKRTDARAESFVARHGEDTVELDALRPGVLQELVKEAVEMWWDQDVAERVLQLEENETAQLQEMVDKMKEERD